MLLTLSQWINTLPVSVWMRRITWIHPVMQTFHILATGIILSSVTMIDLRLWGVSRSQTLVDRGRRFLPWFWVALVVATVTGVGLMLGAPRSFRDTAFVAKLYMMGTATVATFALPFLLRWNSSGNQKDARGLVTLIGTVTLLLWLGATFAGRGRWIAGLLGI